MSKGRFGVHGGQYIPETLMNEIIRLEEAYEFYKNDKDFNDELNTLLIIIRYNTLLIDVPITIYIYY